LEANVLEMKYQYYVARLATWVDRLPEAERLLRRARDHFGPEPWITRPLADNLRDQGRFDEAIELLLEAGRDTIAEPLDDDVGWAIRRGNREAVDRHLADAEREGDYRWASAIAYFDDRYDEAMEYIEKWWPEELECRSYARTWLLADYPRLIDRPRFQEMMDVAGIPWRESEVWAE
jgi:tetratricopeptide (TPR) repeat protein